MNISLQSKPACRKLHTKQTEGNKEAKTNVQKVKQSLSKTPLSKGELRCVSEPTSEIPLKYLAKE